jgi:F0F1-type ATP synthase assembly protein I
MEPKPPHNNKKPRLTDYARYSGLAIQMLATILICVYLGHKLDQWIGWKFPAGIFIGMFVGLFGALYPAFKQPGNKN